MAHDVRSGSGQATAVVFLQWLIERISLLERQAETAEIFKDALINLDIPRCLENIDSQLQFVNAAHGWNQVCEDFWKNLGFDKATQALTLDQWLIEQQTAWQKLDEFSAVLKAWAQFKDVLGRVKELNDVSQTLIGHLSEDNRRKLQALISFTGQDDMVYTHEGANQVGVTHATSSSNPAGAGRLLAKG